MCLPSFYFIRVELIQHFFGVFGHLEKAVIKYEAFTLSELFELQQHYLVYSVNSHISELVQSGKNLEFVPSCKSRRRLSFLCV